MPVTPKLKSYLIADMVFRQDNGKWCVIGVFDKILAPKYPVIHGTLGLFMQVTDAEGDYNVGIEFRDSEDRCHSILPSLKLQVRNRLATVEFGMQTRQLIIPAPGNYRFCLSFNGEVIDDIPLSAIEITGEQPNV
ncbi:MAG: hypothetical protein O3B01_13590 [Planctomycetota bacterium]|nr:hypothetical protein [Planctomycetota bacterium]MDA1139607.1 hypothetical protein [Planctomycetota bacterium]